MNYRAIYNVIYNVICNVIYTAIIVCNLHCEKAIITKSGVKNMGEEASLSDLAGIYKDVANVVGVDNARKMFDSFHGEQLTFPKKFYSAEYMERQIVTEYQNGKSIRDLVREYDYSESRIRQILRKYKK